MSRLGKPRLHVRTIKLALAAALHGGELTAQNKKNRETG